MRNNWRRLARIIFGLSLLLPATGFAQTSADAPGSVLTARLAQSGSGAEVELGLSLRAAFRIFTLSDPMRVVVDMPDTVWQAEPPRPGAGLRLIEDIRFGIAEPGMARMVIDLRGPARVVQAFTADSQGSAPARLAVILAPTSEAEFAAKAGWPNGLGPVGAAADSGERAELPDSIPVPRPRPKRDVHVIIDPGHGGKDPGAVSDGVEEKDLVLAYAEALAAEISARTGFRAFLTREGDEFLSLRDRVAFARRTQGDIFISLHADALEIGVASGASVFTLSDEASDQEAAALSASHDRADIIAGVPLDAEEDDVTRVLVDFARRQTDTLSVDLAQALVERLKKTTPVLDGRALQSAGFRVLKAPDVPSVLVELGFMSSAADKARLLSPEGRGQIVEALASGILDWAMAQEGERFRPARPRQAE